MEHIINCRFILLATSNNHIDITPEELVNIYSNFMNSLTRTVDEESNYRVIFRLLSELEAMLSIMVTARSCNNKKKL